MYPRQVIARPTTTDSVRWSRYRGAELIDLGCGRGADLQRVAASSQDESARFSGIDNSDAAEDAVRRLPHAEPRIEFRREQLGTPLPFDDASIDVVVSHNLLDAATALSADLILQPVGACRAL